MARAQLITRDYLVKGMQAGMTSEEMAADLGVKVGSINNKKSQFELSDPQLNHKWAVPWVLDPEDKHSTEAQYLQALSTAAQSRNFRASKVRPAVNWAVALMDAKKDITYDHGWKVVDVPEGSRSHIRMVLEAAENGELPDTH